MGHDNNPKGSEHQQKHEGQSQQQHGQQQGQQSGQQGQHSGQQQGGQFGGSQQPRSPQDREMDQRRRDEMGGTRGSGSQSSDMNRTGDQDSMRDEKDSRSHDQKSHQPSGSKDRNS